MFIIFVLMLFKFSDRILIKRFLIFLSIMLTIWVSFYYLFGEFVQNNYKLHHFDAYFYPIKKIQSGLTPLVDFHSLYGGYAYFFAFILGFFSKNYTIVFSIICALLFIISFYMLAYVSYKNINNKVLWFLFYCLIIFCSVVSFLYRFKSPYLQYVPHRIVFPAIILFYINYYIRKKSDNVALKLYGFVISSFALFWNLETGIIVLLTWFSFLVYEELYKNSFVYLKFKKFILFLMFLILLSIVFYLLMIIGITYLRTHKLINIFDLFFGITSFAGYGMYMVRMKLLHPWILLMIIYSVGLAISISNIKKFRKTKENFRDNAMFFALSVLGIGIFSYYQGRSVDMYFLLICYPGIILLGMYVDRLFVKKKRILLLPVLFIVIIIDLSNLYYLCNEKINSEIKSDFIDNTSLTYVDLVKRFDNLDFIVPYESWYYDKYNLEDKKTFPSYVDLFKYSDIEKVIDYLYVCENNVVMSRFELSIIKEYYYEDYKRLLNKYSKEKYDNRVVVLVLKDDDINDKE